MRLFSKDPSGSITWRKVRRVFPFIQSKDMANTIIDLAWSQLLAIVPLMLTTKFPKAMAIMWETMERLEALSKEPDESDWETDVQKLFSEMSKNIDD